MVFQEVQESSRKFDTSRNSELSRTCQNILEPPRTLSNFPVFVVLSRQEGSEKQDKKGLAGSRNSRKFDFGQESLRQLVQNFIELPRALSNFLESAGLLDMYETLSTTAEVVELWTQ